MLSYGSRVLLRDVSLGMEPGRIYGLAAPSGRVRAVGTHGQLLASRGEYWALCHGLKELG